ncbi:DUF1569 domain-containing protein [Chitinophaga vietnamensis]|uniref:DUF1569 domain-containing protein n=1 Tax=Chitinophaga vietnamensis TaxID=2593957 RepID=UPI00117757AD|nr:DUF1569 domain-containing protein [Chitinophaga vietnamensis]
MKTAFDPAMREQLLIRIEQLHENSLPLWGKMNVRQMLMHCRLWEEMVVGRLKTKRIFMGYLFGKMAMRSLFQKNDPLPRNAISAPELIVTGAGAPDIEREKRAWMRLIESHAHFSNEGFIHPFFGKMEREQIGRMIYKHADHHLRQFNC